MSTATPPGAPGTQSGAGVPGASNTYGAQPASGTYGGRAAAPSPAPLPRPPAGRGGRPRFGFGLVGPRRDRHSVSVEQLDALALPVGDDGMVIGVDAEGRPAVLGINRPVPYD
ncbi:hypothetical protein GT043_32310, partial [Streptomyces sp. SID2131]|nr:hypothetical protein [Streptomyces sp. SID2131]